MAGGIAASRPSAIRAVVIALFMSWTSGSCVRGVAPSYRPAGERQEAGWGIKPRFRQERPSWRPTERSGPMQPPMGPPEARGEAKQARIDGLDGAWRIPYVLNKPSCPRRHEVLLAQ